jgi:quercetin dioxygenase-like cupin family protein
MSTPEITPARQEVFVANNSVEWQPMAEGVRRKILAYDEQLMMVRVSFEKGGIGSLHQHRHVQITNVESGKFEVEIGGKKSILQAGDAFYVPPNALHGCVCLEAGVLIDVFSPMREDFFESPTTV